MGIGKKPNTEHNKPKQSHIDQVPEELRRSIKFWSVTLVMALVVVGWLISENQTIRSIHLGNRQPDDWQSVAEDISHTFNTAKDQFGDLTNQVKELGAAYHTASTTDQATAIKQQIIDQETKGWQQFHDTSTDVVIRYPNSVMVTTATSTTNSIIATFQYRNQQTILLELKKFQTFTEFNQVPYLKMYIQKNNTYVAAFSTIPATATDATTTMMLLTLK